MLSVPRTCLLAALLVCASGCNKPTHIVKRPLLGTFVTITAVADDATALRAAGAAFDEIARIQALMSPVLESSDVYRLNGRGGAGYTPVSRETFTLIKESVRISRETGGAFDITFAPLARLWDYRKKDFVPPLPGEVTHLLPLVGSGKIVLDDAACAVLLPARGMKLGLGAIAKGYAVRRAVAVLRREGVAAGIVEAGGDLQVFGGNAGEPWTTGLVHPRGESLLLGLTLNDGDAVATSGDYERFVMYRGKRYHHILDPRTGYPTETFSSVSVIAPDPVLADAYATALFVLGPVHAPAFLKSHPELSVILVDLNLRIAASRSLKNRITMLVDAPVRWL